MDYKDASLATVYLSTQRTFGQSFELYLKKILRILGEAAIAVRTKAMKCLAAVVEVDPGLLERGLSLDDKLSLDGFMKLKKNYVNKRSVLSSVINDQGVEVFGIDAILNEYRNDFVTRLTPAKMDIEMGKFEEMHILRKM